jgi:hypothetical protein
LSVRRISIAAVLLSSTTAACSAILGLEPPPADAGGGDATTSDASSADAPSADAPTGDVVCTPVEPVDGAAPGTTYHAFTNFPTNDAGDYSWEVYDVSALSNAAADYQGGVFDGRYVYLVPSANGLVLRLDTMAPFRVKASWWTFDTTTLNPAIEGFSGGVFDGRYVYFVPSSGKRPVVARYDTQGAFDQTPSWAAFDTATIPVPDGGAPTTSFRGGTFDGRYVYFAPFGNSSGGHSGRVYRYDTQAADAGAPQGGVDGGDSGLTGVATFGSIAAWSTFDTSTQYGSALGFAGAVVDDQSFVYFVPNNNLGANNGGFSGVVSRYDSTKAFGTTGAWSSYDMTAINASAFGFYGGAFDGRYLYFVPREKTVVTRFDTQATAFNKAAWSTFDVAPFLQSDAGGTGFFGAAFDGRFVYFVPATGVAVRYDTQSTFTAPCAWSSFDVSKPYPSAMQFSGAVFDGKFLYLVPHGTFVTRFDTKTPASMPPNLPQYHGSFY